MRRIGVLCLLGAMAVGANASAAEEANPKQQRRQLEQERRDVRSGQNALRQAVLESPLLESARNDAELARLRYELARATDRDVVRARNDLVAAEARLKALAEAAYRTSPEFTALQTTLAKLRDQEGALRHRQDQLRIHLRHEGSPLVRKVEADEAVEAARKAMAEAEQALRRNVTKAERKAQKELAAARAAVDAVRQAVRDDAAVRKAQAVLNRAEQALREAREADPRRAIVEQARDTYETTRAAQLARQDEAQPLPKLEAELQKVEQRIHQARELLDVRRDALREKQAGRVDAAAKKLEAARAAYEKLLKKDPFAKAAKAVAAAYKTFHEKHASMFEKLPEYAALTKKADQLRQEALKLARQGAQNADQAQKKAAAVAELNEQVSGLEWQRRDIRISVGGKEWDTIWHARGVQQNALDELVDANPAAAAARSAVEDAEEAVDAAVEAELRDEPGSQALLQDIEKLQREREEVEYAIKLVEHEIAGRGSPVRDEVESAPTVAALRQAWRQAERDLRNNPSKAVEKAERAVDEARAQRNQRVDAKQDALGYDALRDAERQAGRDLRDARKSDPKREALDKARDALKQARQDALKAQDKAVEILEQIAALEVKRDAVRNQRKDVENQLRDLRRRFERGDSPLVADAREDLNRARRRLEEALGDPKILALKARKDAAQKALQEQVNEVLSVGVELQKLRQKEEEIKQKLKALRR